MDETLDGRVFEDDLVGLRDVQFENLLKDLLVVGQLFLQSVNVLIVDLDCLEGWLGIVEQVAVFLRLLN